MKLEQVLAVAYAQAHGISAAPAEEVERLKKSIDRVEASKRLIELEQLDPRRCYVSTWQRDFLRRLMSRP